MRPNRLFFPQPLLDAWLVDERVDLEDKELLLRDEKRRYVIDEAFHVVREVDGGDRQGLVGTVKTREQLAALGAEVFEGSMILGDSAYDVVPGFVGEPVGTADAGSPSADVGDEDLLAQFLLKSL
jgi:hypothetical protein